ncbi:hypothetical protein SAMN05421823_102359 [Catalinimonas alkaloidigena]|uniref:Uncharacterized protein n=1 Tax=Catalinimonas alkaloidigena TaxID=1075417 RepID=A0A1G9APP7_9BACT|nr:hypothetical protein SAMN05421823_102359 [Catalinimonas alkaloidigena]
MCVYPKLFNYFYQLGFCLVIFYFANLDQRLQWRIFRILFSWK